MYPSVQKPYSGIFVKNQYEYLKNVLKQEIEIFTMRRTFSSKIGSVLKYAKAFILFTPYYFRKYNVIHLHYFFPMIILATMYKVLHPTTKIVVTFHGSDITNFINSSISKKFFRVLINKCDFVISVGNELSKLVYKKLNKKPDLVLCAGIDEKIFYFDDSLKKAYDFIFVGSFIKRKGLDILLEAIQMVDDKSIKYCIVGSGELKSDVLNITDSNTIVLLENRTQTQLRELYNKSKYFVLPSRDEPFGLVVSEAIFCGTPALVSNIGGIKDQVKDGINGYILKKNTPEYLASKIKKLNKLNDKEYTILKENALKSNKEYSMSSVCKRLLEIYMGLVKKWKKSF